MERNLGIDLGTTNSTVCFYNYERNAFDYLRFDENNLNYFPSMLTYRPNEDIPLIGFAARKKMHIKGSHYFLGREIKLNLGRNAIVRGRNVKDLLRDQIGTIIGKYVDQKQYIPSHIVLTVPARWTESGSSGKETVMLREVFKELGFDTNSQIQFESEPVAAAAYFCHEVMKDAFHGCYLIIDYGGGTLDITICQIDDNNTIRVLYKDGKTGSDAFGCAGEAFDMELCKKMIVENQIDVPLDASREIDTSAKAFIKLQRCVEEWKISLSSTTTAVLKKYYSMDENKRKRYLNKKAFDVCTPNDEEYPITVEAIIEAFDKVNKPVLKMMIENALAYCKNQEINYADGSDFRVILTGGFSNLYCVDATVCEVFHVPYDCEELRFSQMIDRNIRSTAIAHGAAIIAENMVTVESVCPENIGICYYDTTAPEKKKAVLIRKNDIVSKYKTPVFMECIIESEWMDQSSCIELFTDSMPYILVSTQELCPEKGRKGVRYQIGLALSDGVPMLYSKDQNNICRIKSLEYDICGDENVWI